MLWFGISFSVHSQTVSLYTIILHSIHIQKLCALQNPKKCLFSCGRARNTPLFARHCFVLHQYTIPTIFFFNFSCVRDGCYRNIHKHSKIVKKCKKAASTVSRNVLKPKSQSPKPSANYHMIMIMWLPVCCISTICTSLATANQRDEMLCTDIKSTCVMCMTMNLCLSLYII